MATLAQPSPSPSPPLRRRSRSWARKCERYCMRALTLFPLFFVYGLTSWACWVQASVGFIEAKGYWTSRWSALLGIAIYVLLNWCYTVAVFTDPGSPLNTKNAYSALPSHEDDTHASSLTVKSTGEIRFCKKCQTRKPDRAHHCSTCRRCVLKMDHHCPWLATCVGLHNYKPFLLFLLYTCLFCFVCFAVSATWVWSEILGDTVFEDTDRMMPVNIVLLSVLSGILGLVLSGFTGWHVYLTLTGQTTIESLEKNRYISPLRKSMHANLGPNRHRVDEENPDADTEPGLADHLREIHANAIPGITRPEEGEETRSVPSPAQHALRSSYAESEAARERARYASYLDELDSAKLPNAFDHGWRANLTHVFGPTPWLWGLPVCNTSGDGWRWQPSPRWVDARADLAAQREQRARQDAAIAHADAGWMGHARTAGVRGGDVPSFAPGSQHSLASLQGHAAPPPVRTGVYASRGDASAAASDDEDDNGDDVDQSTRPLVGDNRASTPSGQWNDLPNEMLGVGAGRGVIRTRSPRPARAYPTR